MLLVKTNRYLDRRSQTLTIKNKCVKSDNTKYFHLFCNSHQIRHQSRDHDRNHEPPHPHGHDPQHEFRKSDVRARNRILADAHARFRIRTSDLVRVEDPGNHSGHDDQEHRKDFDPTGQDGGALSVGK